MKRYRSGFSLVEVLVSVVVVSVGALSVASLQLVSKRTVRDAGQRMEATQMAHALLERLNANNSQEALAAYVAGAAPFLGLGRLSGEDEPVPSPLCLPGEACSPSELALVDLYVWERFLDGANEQYGGADAGGLLFPTACLTGPAIGAGQAGNYTLTIAYRGAAALPANNGVACGSGATFSDGSALYGSAQECGDKGADCFRRSIVVQAFIAPSVPK